MPVPAAVVKSTNSVTGENDETMSANLESYIEQTLLRVDVTEQMIEELCHQVKGSGILGVCVPPFYTSTASKILKDSPVKVITVVGFPFGYTNITSKAEATKKVIFDGADEVDLVMNISAFLSENYSQVADEMESVHTLCNMNDRVLKVIVEASLLNETQLAKACEICVEKEVDFVKTSTGFNGGGATVDMVRFMRSVLPAGTGIKASGGIKTRQMALDLIEAGADRIGTSSGFEILGA